MLKRENTVFIEYCHSCTTHYWCTKHDESKYKQFYETIKEEILDNFEELTVVGNISPYNLKPIIPQLGAFEIIFRDQVIFSKLATLQWPSKTKIVKKVTAVKDGIEYTDEEVDAGGNISMPLNQLSTKASTKKYLLPQTYTQPKFQTTADMDNTLYSGRPRNQYHSTTTMPLLEENRRMSGTIISYNNEEGQIKGSPRRNMNNPTMMMMTSSTKNSRANMKLSNAKGPIKGKKDYQIDSRFPDIQQKHHQEENTNEKNGNGMISMSQTNNKIKNNLMNNYSNQRKKPHIKPWKNASFNRDYAEDYHDEDGNNNDDDDFTDDYSKLNRSPKLWNDNNNIRNKRNKSNTNQQLNGNNSKSLISQESFTPQARSKSNLSYHQPSKSSSKQKIGKTGVYSFEHRVPYSGNIEYDRDDREEHDNTDITKENIMNTSNIDELIDLNYIDFKITQIKLPKDKISKKKIYLAFNDEGKHIIKLYTAIPKLINLSNSEIITMNPGPIKLPLKFEYHNVDYVEYFIFAFKDGKPWTKISIQVTFITEAIQQDQDQLPEKQKETDPIQQQYCFM